MYNWTDATRFDVVQINGTSLLTGIASHTVVTYKYWPKAVNNSASCKHVWLPRETTRPRFS